MGGKAPTNCKEQQTEPFDVRRLHAARKQSAIMSMFDGLKPGQTFSVILDFDPGRLKRQLEGSFAGDFVWVCLEIGPPEWLIEIGKREPAR
ncbi:DUF2249 domain-containing protein [Mesorhizobium sp. MSK_1335]|uniref:DUF2249 domain-containing protein n=1 Tax=Mesorhizobium montanum TaxID=3072323 RepID=A0ABU4ZSC5_9HYPH|nr:DUF2249 domain-containing protein [Mesorhizobium sp. MSK_1335]MDX8528304.1 DUF2249 domain-containing protein [Mesorhizobium sp. MSK_1335]